VEVVEEREAGRMEEEEKKASQKVAVEKASREVVEQSLACYQIALQRRKKDMNSNVSDAHETRRKQPDIPSPYVFPEKRDEGTGVASESAT